MIREFFIDTIVLPNLAGIISNASQEFFLEGHPNLLYMGNYWFPKGFERKYEGRTDENTQISNPVLSN